MTNIDQFESLFKKADKTRFNPEPVNLETVLVVTDVDGPQTAQFAAEVRRFLAALEREDSVAWKVLPGEAHTTVVELLAQIEQISPDLICTYRNLHAPATDYPYTLGVYLDVLAQVASAPVMVLPGPHRPESQIPDTTKNVMAITDHLTGDHHLVSFAARMTSRNGHLLLTHVEDEVVFDRYMAAIAKIATIETDNAREAIMEQLLREPHEFISSCGEVLREAGLPIEIEEIVTIGHYLKDYQRLVEEHSVDLLLLNTKHEDQLAMHGVAYPLCVELRDIPILML